METMYLYDRVHGDVESVECRREQSQDVFGPIGEVIPDAHDAAVVCDDTTAVTVDESQDEFFGCLVDERLLPGLESNRALVFPARAVLGKQARPMLGVQRDFDAAFRQGTNCGPLA